MKEVILIFAIAFFLFLEVSTILIDQNSVGLLGHYFGFYSREIFGYMAFIYPMYFLFVSYSIYRTEFFDTTFMKKLSIIILLFFALLVAQALIVQNELSGLIGDFLVTNLMSILGPIGIWIFVFASIAISIIILFDIAFEELFYRLLGSINLNIFKLRENGFFTFLVTEFSSALLCS